jgi:hypothetical protein
MKKHRGVLMGTLVCVAAIGATFAVAQQPAPSLTESSPEEVLAAVEALYEDAVPWREIQWDTCLLEGLKKSRTQRKPLMLWIFIDRPIDDERC